MYVVVLKPCPIFRKLAGTWESDAPRRTRIVVPRNKRHSYKTTADVDRTNISLSNDDGDIVAQTTFLYQLDAAYIGSGTVEMSDIAGLISFTQALNHLSS